VTITVDATRVVRSISPLIYGGTVPPLDSPAAQAFALYTHYDDRGDVFGDQSIATAVDASPDYVTAYGSIDSSTGDVVLVAINKRSDAPFRPPFT
jgi:hypothetical protein